MKKRNLFALLLIVSLSAGHLTGCGSVESGDTQPSETTQAPEATQSAAENPIGVEDTYWTAVSCFNEETGENEELLPGEWAMNLMVRGDGTARFRDIQENISLSDDSLLDLRWEQSAEAEYVFYSSLRSEPVLRGSWEDGILSLEYYDMQLTMEQGKLPQTVGETYSPAELRGTWLQMSGETEGWEWEAMPGKLSSIVFDTTYTDERMMLIADMEERDYYEDLMYSAYDQEVTVLEEPLYEGCENESWSVRIGPASAVDENGVPLETETYATLIDYNTLQVQQYYNLDGYPAVSHQTYWRFPELVSWTSPEYMELDYSNWVCTAYTNFQREDRYPPAEMEGFGVILDPDGTCLVSYGDGARIQGTWTLYTGGVLVLRGSEDEFWFGGTITQYCQVVDHESYDVYQMSLYYDGGILRLSLESFG